MYSQLTADRMQARFCLDSAAMVVIIPDFLAMSPTLEDEANLLRALEVLQATADQDAAEN